jgi:acylphosphatase
MDTTVARQVWFSGYVQGVGFRFTAQRIASRYKLTGYVRNLDDGRVEMFAQGTSDDIDRCLADLGDTFGAYIREVQATDAQLSSGYTSFVITH